MLIGVAYGIPVAVGEIIHGLQAILIRENIEQCTNFKFIDKLKEVWQKFFYCFIWSIFEPRLRKYIFYGVLIWKKNFYSIAKKRDITNKMYTFSLSDILNNNMQWNALLLFVYSRQAFYRHFKFCACAALFAGRLHEGVNWCSRLAEREVKEQRMRQTWNAYKMLAAM